MRILITTDWYAPIINGVVTSVLNLEKELRKNGHEVRVLTLSSNYRSYKKDNIVYIGSFGAGLIYPNARMKIPLHSKYVSELIRWKPDIIHSQCEFSTFLFARKITRYLGIPIVHTYHTIYEDYTHYFSLNQKWGRKAAARFSRWISHYCERVIAPTEKVKKMLEGYNIRCSVSVIPTGINLNKFFSTSKSESDKIKSNLNIKSDDFTAVYIGRLAQEKNINELIEMHARIKNPHIKLLIVGDGPHRAALEQLVKSHNLFDRVIFAGMVSPNEVAQYYKCGDVFVSASVSETQGLTYIEALASGLPVICRKDKCLDNVIDDMINGLKYTSADEYCSTIKELAANRTALKRMNLNALDSVGKFSCENFGVQAEQLYSEVIFDYVKRRQNLSLV